MECVNLYCSQQVVDLFVQRLVEAPRLYQTLLQNLLEAYGPLYRYHGEGQAEFVIREESTRTSSCQGNSRQIRNSDKCFKHLVVLKVYVYFGQRILSIPPLPQMQLAQVKNVRFHRHRPVYWL